MKKSKTGNQVGLFVNLLRYLRLQFVVDAPPWVLALAVLVAGGICFIVAGVVVVAIVRP